MGATFPVGFQERLMPCQPCDVSGSMMPPGTCMWRLALGKMVTNGDTRRCRRKRRGGRGRRCLSAGLLCSPETTTSQAGNTALSREAQVLLSLVEAVLFSLVRGRVKEEHKPLRHGMGCPARAGSFSWFLVNPIHWRSRQLLPPCLCRECC